MVSPASRLDDWSQARTFLVSALSSSDSSGLIWKVRISSGPYRVERVTSNVRLDTNIFKPADLRQLHTGCSIDGEFFLGSDAKGLVEITAGHKDIGNLALGDGE